MYPLHHHRLFPPYPIVDRVFVAMDFSPKFDKRWREVIEPAILASKRNGQPLNAHRVDTSRISAYQVTPLGHAIARRVADSMMGHLTAEQIEGLKEFGSRGKS